MAATAPGPLGAQILTREAALESLGQQVQVLQESVSADVQLTNNAYLTWQAAAGAQSAVESKMSDAAADAYIKSQQLGPYTAIGGDIAGLGLLVPGLGTAPTDAESTAKAAAQARLVTSNAHDAYQAAQATQAALQAQADALQATYTTDSTALDTLKAQNEVAIAQAAAAQAALDASRGAGIGSSVNGQAANPLALAAVHFALSQIGKPYVFGAEGPNSYDCSGLTWAAYQSAGITIPRIARYQQHALTAISPSALLPGDLIFFSGTNGTSWTTVSHVGMYYGRSSSGEALMIEAPFTGENVKIAPVWWSHYFSAARVVPAVAAPTTPPTSPTPTPTPTPTPSDPPSSPPPSSPPPSSPPPSSPPPSSPPPSSPPPSSPPPSSPPPSSPPPSSPPPSSPPPSSPPPSSPAPSDPPSPSDSPSAAGPSTSPSADPDPSDQPSAAVVATN